MDERGGRERVSANERGVEVGIMRGCVRDMWEILGAYDKKDRMLFRSSMVFELKRFGSHFLFRLRNQISSKKTF